MDLNTSRYFSNHKTNTVTKYLKERQHCIRKKRFTGKFGVAVLFKKLTA